MIHPENFLTEGDILTGLFGKCNHLLKQIGNRHFQVTVSPSEMSGPEILDESSRNTRVTAQTSAWARNFKPQRNR